MMPSRRRYQSGFTLLELLAAVALLSIGFAIFLNGMGYATRALTKDKQTTQLSLLAKSILDEETKGRLKPGEWRGKIDEVSWRLTLTLTSSKPPVELYQVELALEQGARRERFTTLRAQGSRSGQAR